MMTIAYFAIASIYATWRLMKESEAMLIDNYAKTLGFIMMAFGACARSEAAIVIGAMAIVLGTVITVKMAKSPTLVALIRQDSDPARTMETLFFNMPFYSALAGLAWPFALVYNFTAETVCAVITENAKKGE